MEIEGRTVLILGGSGLVGRAVARRVVRHRPASVVISALGRAEAEAAVEELRASGSVPAEMELRAEWGDMFLPEAVKTQRRAEVVVEAETRALLLDDLFGELTDEVVERSALGALLARHGPEIIVDCVNTATAFAYQDVYESAEALRSAARRGEADADAVERHLAALHLPQLIRHVQIALEGMRRAGTRMYVKVGTSGTGGMGLNVPFTHSEERPSRTLLAKSGLAGAHTLLLFLMARTPDGPAVTEIKPTAAISWKRIGYGEVRRHGRAIERWDATGPIPLEDAFGADAAGAYRRTGETLEGVYLDAGENGYFSRAEFETITALGLMEFITPEEIADNVLRELLGHPTGRDVVAALDASTSGPTYRAGLLRQGALEYMEELEAKHGVDAVAYEMLGPPRLTKLLFEGAILARLFNDLAGVASLEPSETAERARAVVEEDDDLRTRVLSVGLPILLPGGRQVLRGPEVKVAPEAGGPSADARAIDNGWVDLRPSNWGRWRARAEAMERQRRTEPAPAEGSGADLEPSDRRGDLRPGRLAAWVLRYEDEGERVKR